MVNAPANIKIIPKQHNPMIPKNNASGPHKGTKTIHQLQSSQPAILDTTNMIVNICNNGNENASKIRYEVASKMTPLQIQEAHRLAKKWIANHP